MWQRRTRLPTMHFGRKKTAAPNQYKMVCLYEMTNKVTQLWMQQTMNVLVWQEIKKLLLLNVSNDKTMHVAVLVKMIACLLIQYMFKFLLFIKGWIKLWLGIDESLESHKITICFIKHSFRVNRYSFEWGINNCIVWQFPWDYSLCGW